MAFGLLWICRHTPDTTLRPDKKPQLEPLRLPLVLSDG